MFPCKIITQNIFRALLIHLGCLLFISKKKMRLVNLLKYGGTVCACVPIWKANIPMTMSISAKQLENLWQISNLILNLLLHWLLIFYICLLFVKFPFLLHFSVVLGQFNPVQYEVLLSVVVNSRRTWLIAQHLHEGNIEAWNDMSTFLWCFVDSAPPPHLLFKHLD